MLSWIICVMITRSAIPLIPANRNMKHAMKDVVTRQQGIMLVYLQMKIGKKVVTLTDAATL